MKLPEIVKSAVEDSLVENNQNMTREGTGPYKNLSTTTESFSGIYDDNSHVLFKRYYFVGDYDDNSTFSTGKSNCKNIGSVQQDLTRDLIFFAYLFRMMKRIFLN